MKSNIARTAAGQAAMNATPFGEVYSNSDYSTSKPVAQPKCPETSLLELALTCTQYAQEAEIGLDNLGANLFGIETGEDSISNLGNSIEVVLKNLRNQLSGLALKIHELAGRVGGN